MLKTIKKAISLALSVFLLFGTVALGRTIASAEETYSVGDTLEYGTYPQSEVKDADTLAALTAKLKDDSWVSYGYYSGTGTWENGQAGGNTAQSDYMKYQDVALDDIKYRAVFFERYRPAFTSIQSIESNSYQDSNGYNTNKVYWFQYEPIEWCVLDSESGLIFCNIAIDSQAFNNILLKLDGEWFGNVEMTNKAYDYSNSSIREWLNNDFINTAFSSVQQENILVSENLNNSIPDDTDFKCASTSDKIFLFSTSDAYHQHPQMLSSDYAKCQGILKDSTGRVCWWLRTPHTSYQTAAVYYNGYFGYAASVNYTAFGICPAMRLQTLKNDPTGVPVEDQNTGFSASLSANEVIRGDKLTWTVTTPIDVVWLRFNGIDGSGNNYTAYYKYNNYNKGTTEVTVTDINSTREWVIPMVFNYPGTQPVDNQVWSIDYKVNGSTEWSEMFNSETEQAYSFNIKVGKDAEALAPDPEPYAKYTLIDASYIDTEESGAQYRYFTVVTTDDVSKIRISYVNESTGKTKTATYQPTSSNVTGIETESGISTWTIRMKITTHAQDDAYTVRCRGSSWGEGMVAHA